MPQKIVTVFGATGKQGGGAVRYLLKDGSFSVRAVTRNPESDSAKALAALGAEVVKADLTDRDSVFKVVKGSYGIFGVTDFWTANGTEEIQGKILVDAAKDAGVRHFVWSTMDHSDLKLPHCETKANVNDYLIESGIPRTSLYTAWFWENIGSLFFPLKRDSKGEIVLDVPCATDGPIPAIAGEDCGVLAGVALKNPEKFIGADIYAATEVFTPRKLTSVIEDILGEKVTVSEMTMEEFEKSKETTWSEMWLTYKWLNLNYQTRDVPGTLALLPEVKAARDILMQRGGKAALLAQVN